MLTVPCSNLILNLNSTSITVPAAEIDRQFSIDETSFPNSYWLVSVWSIGFAVVPLFVMPLVEELGVRWAYLVLTISHSSGTM